MTPNDAQQILDKCVEIENTTGKMIPNWMKITISIECPREAIELVYASLLKPFGMDKQFAAGEIVHYKGVRLIIQP